MFLILGFLWTTLSLASSSLEYSYQEYQNNLSSTLDYHFDEELKDDEPKRTTYNLDVSVVEGQTPTTNSTVNLAYSAGNLYFTPGFSTTLYTNAYTLKMGWTTPTEWEYEVDFGYSRQVGAGTPNVLSYLPAVGFAKKIELGSGS